MREQRTSQVMADDEVDVATAIAAEEAALRAEIERSMAVVRNEARQMQMIKDELELLEAPVRHDVDHLRKRIEAIDRRMLSNQQRTEKAKARVQVARSAVEDKRRERTVLSEHLELVTNERRKEKADVLKDLKEKLEFVRAQAAARGI